VRAALQTVTAPQSAMPHFVPDNEHLDPRGISNSSTAAPNRAVASSSQKPLEDGLKVTISCHTYYLFIISMLIGILQLLVKEDLKKWIDEHNIVVKSTNKLRSKEGAFKT
jgi:hypothetical protein